jgi:hypothetical protein
MTKDQKPNSVSVPEITREVYTGTHPPETVEALFQVELTRRRGGRVVRVSVVLPLKFVIALFTGLGGLAGLIFNFILAHWH